MATWLKQSTAVDIALGPFLDETDGKTAETALTISQADVRLKKNAGAWAQKSESTSASHEEAGWYEVNLDTTDTNTLGILVVAVHESGALPAWRESLVVPANEYDSFILGTDALDVEVASMAANTVTASAIATDAIGAAELADGAITAATFAAGAIDATAIATDAIGAAEIADGAITAATFAAGAVDAAAIAADAIDASALAADAVTEIQSGLATAAALDTVDNFLDTEIAAILAAVDTEVAAILAAVAALNNLSAAQVNAEVVDALATDTYAELTDPPAATSPLSDKITWLFQFLARNKLTQTATTLTTFADDGSTALATSTVSDDGTTFTRGEITP